MNPLEWPDTIHLSAAEGWLELGNHLEADAELHRAGLLGSSGLRKVWASSK